MVEDQKVGYSPTSVDAAGEEQPAKNASEKVEGRRVECIPTSVGPVWEEPEQPAEVDH